MGEFYLLMHSLEKSIHIMERRCYVQGVTTRGRSSL